MKQKFDLLIGFICYWIIMILPLKYTWKITLKLLPSAGYYANHPIHYE